jgi:hypothetical protein
MSSANNHQLLSLKKAFLISNFRRVLNAVCFLLGNSQASEFRRRGIVQKKAYNKKALSDITHIGNPSYHLHVFTESVVTEQQRYMLLNECFDLGQGAQ